MDTRLAKVLDRGHLMADKQHRASTSAHLLHFAETFLLESCVSHGQNFIDDEYLRLKMRCHRKGKPDVHAARVTLDRCVQELFYFGEINDLIKLASDFLPVHAQNRTVEVD